LHLVQSHLALPSTTDTFTQDPLDNDNNDDEDDDDDNDNENATPAAPKPSHTKHPLLHQILHTSQSGTLALITPLTEDSYRRLSNLASFLASTLDSPCSLNPRAFRSAADHSINSITTSEGGWDAGTGARGVLDGNLLMRWGELGERGRREGLGKYGEGQEGEWMFWGEREVLAGWGVFGGRGR
jgi:cleavage and polyadenylation specificity factor subunit 1